MKTYLKTRCPNRFLAPILVLLGAIVSSPAATFIKADNANFLHLASSWLTNGITATVAPTTNDTVVWDVTVSGANLSLAPDANVSWRRIVISNPPGPVTIANPTTARTVSLNEGLTIEGRI